MKEILRHLYNNTLRNRRLRHIVDILLPHMPDRGTILDLGCGSGHVAAALKERNPQLEFVGLDVMARPEAAIPVITYDGTTIPYGDQSFDYVMLITVLHHTDDYVPVLKEAARVARKGLIILDHQYASRTEWWVLACIDWPGNVPFGVYTPLNFKKRTEWKQLFQQLHLEEIRYDDRIFLFGKWADRLLGRHMHFVSLLSKNNPN